MTALPPAKRKAPPVTTPKRAFQDQQMQGNFSVTEDAAQVADGINPFARFSAVWAACVRPTSRKLVLLALTDFADADGTNIRPSVATVAARCNISATQARAHISALANTGVIRVTREASQHRATVYALDFATLAGLPPTGALKDPRAPVDRLQHPSTPTSGPQSTGADPGNYPGKTPRAGGGVSSGPGFAGPKGIDPAIWAKWIKQSGLDSGEVRELVTQGEELRARGADLTALVKQAIANNWRRWPRVGGSTTARGSRYGENFPGKVWGLS